MPENQEIQIQSNRQNLQVNNNGTTQTTPLTAEPLQNDFVFDVNNLPPECPPNSDQEKTKGSRTAKETSKK